MSLRSDSYFRANGATFAGALPPFAEFLTTGKEPVNISPAPFGDFFAAFDRSRLSEFVGLADGIRTDDAEEGFEDAVLAEAIEDFVNEIGDFEDADACDDLPRVSDPAEGAEALICDILLAADAFAVLEEPRLFAPEAGTLDAVTVAEESALLFP